MILCYNKSENSFKIYGLEINHAFKNKNLRVYDKAQGKFFKDVNCTEEAQVKGETILTRATSDRENDMLVQAILKEGGEVIGDEPVENSNIRRWPKFVHTQRRMTMLQGVELLEYNQKQLQQILDTISDDNDNIFFKTKSGDFSKLIRKDELLQKDSVLRRIISKYPDEEYILSQPLQVEQDKLGNREYRTIVVDNAPGQTPKIASISRYAPDTYHQISQEVLDECRRIANIIHSTVPFPERYVLDVVEYKDNKTGQTRIDVLELKPVSIAPFEGLYSSVDDLEQDQEQEQSDEQLCHVGPYVYDIAPEKKEDFIERGESPSTTPSKKIIPLENKKKTKFAKAYELGNEIVRSNVLKHKRKSKEKQNGKKGKKNFRIIRETDT